jgi:hypothetical protein
MTFFSAIKKRWYLNILFSYIYFSHKMGLLQSCLTYHYISCISIILNLVGYLLPLFLYWKDGLVGGLDFLRFSLSLSLSLIDPWKKMPKKTLNLFWIYNYWKSCKILEFSWVMNNPPSLPNPLLLLQHSLVRWVVWDFVQ